MMRSLYTGVSGLTNHQTRMDVLSNNIANVNTIGYKGSRTVFSSALSQTMQGATSPRADIGGINAKQIGLGVKTSSIDILFTKTSFQTTNVNTDLAINNNGFFIVNQGNQSYYTRAGNFYFDENGNFLTNEGLKVQGWMADSNGNINSAAPLEAIVIPVTSTIPPKISKAMDYKATNLSADSKYGDAETTSVDLVDSQGYEHRTTTNFTKVGANMWIASTNVEGTTGKTSGSIKIVTFDEYGNFASVSDAATNGNIDTSTMPPTIQNVLNGALQLDANAALGDTITGKLIFTDENGLSHSLTLEAECTTGNSGASDAEWTINIVENGVSLANTTVNPSTSPVTLPSVTLSNGATYSLSGSEVTVAPINTVITPEFGTLNTSTVPATIENVLSGILQLDANAVLNATVDGTIAFTDENGIPHVLTVEAVCTTGTSGASDAEWTINISENGAIIGSSVVNPGSGTVDLPDVTLSNGTMYSLAGSQAEVVVAPGAPSFVTSISGSVITPPLTIQNILSDTLQLDANAVLNDTFNGIVAFTDEHGVSHALVIEAICTTGTSGASDAEWTVNILKEGAIVGSSTVNTASGTVDLPDITLNATTYSLSGLEVKVAPINTFVPPTFGTTDSFTIPPTVQNVLTAPLELNAQAMAGAVVEGSIFFIDEKGYARALGVKATCTTSYDPDTPADAVWKLEVIENSRVVGSTIVNSGALATFPPLVLTDGSTYQFDASTTATVTANPAAPSFITPKSAGTNNPLTFYPLGGPAVPMSVTAIYDQLTQYAGSSTKASMYTDGYIAGDLVDKTIDAAGVIVGTYSNGQMLNLAQIAMAIFNNQQGLERAGSTLFTKSNNSGDPIIGTAGSGGIGTLQAGAVEMSNVDLAEEFTNMIVTQRGYQSNSRVITTSDELLQELLNLKR